MFSQIVILIVLLFSVFGIAIWFYNEKQATGRIHSETISKLESAIHHNHNQISFRNSHLNCYDFLKYNLDEALVRQLEIVIK
ncbi:MAG TPA: hypothetical protein VKX40_04070 [Aequorivita sp.]|nr:hypothetical protein [Aequorivita sp.]